MEHPHRVNLLLSLLPPEDLERLQPHLQRFEMIHGAVLVERGEPFGHVYFPTSGAISLVLGMENGARVEAVMLGRDGVLGASTAVCPDHQSFAQGLVQIPGLAWRLSISAFKEAFEQSADLRQLAFRYSEAAFAHAQQSAACNASHDLPSRFARWLMRSRDLAGDDLPLTQDFLSQMLAVRRTSVTAAAQALEAAGLIAYRRGRLHITDVEGLRAACCECYQTVKDYYDQLLPGTARSHLHALSSVG
jgi:CRP-like cAMP-binding protein